MPETFYTILGIDSKASETEIRKAYRRLAIKWHPDKNPTNLQVANEKFKSIAEAYEVLSDQGKRSQYDDSLCGRRANTQQYEQYDQSRDPLRGFDFSSDYSGRRARDIFDHFFSTFQNDFFDNPFPEQHFPQQQSQRSEGGRRESNSRDFFAGFGGSFGGDPFGRNSFFGGDPFSHFGHNMGQMCGSSTSSTYISNGRSGKSVSTSTTYDRHGRAVTRKETTTHHPDGTSETVVENSVTESPQQVEYHNNYGRSSNQGAGMSIQSNSSSDAARNYGQSVRGAGFNDNNRSHYYNNQGNNNNTSYRNNGGTQPYGGSYGH
jgi:DnaJ homolog subfamily B member 6